MLLRTRNVCRYSEFIEDLQREVYELKVQKIDIEREVVAIEKKVQELAEALQAHLAMDRKSVFSAEALPGGRRSPSQGCPPRRKAGTRRDGESSRVTPEVLSKGRTCHQGVSVDD